MGKKSKGKKKNPPAKANDGITSNDIGAQPNDVDSTDMEQKIRLLKISDIKSELESLGISTRHFVEKDELVNALLQARGDRHQQGWFVQGTRVDAKPPKSDAEASQNDDDYAAAINEHTAAMEREKVKSMSTSDIKKELKCRGLIPGALVKRDELVDALVCARNVQAKYNHEVMAIFDEGEDLGFVYTVGMHPKKRELFALNVRRVDYEKVCLLMNFLSDRVVLGGQVAGDEETGGTYAIHSIDDEEVDRALKAQYLCQMNTSAKTLMLRRFGHAGEKTMNELLADLNLSKLNCTHGSPLNLPPQVNGFMDFVKKEMEKATRSFYKVLRNNNDGEEFLFNEICKDIVAQAAETCFHSGNFDGDVKDMVLTCLVTLGTNYLLDTETKHSTRLAGLLVSPVLALDGLSVEKMTMSKKDLDAEQQKNKMKFHDMFMDMEREFTMFFHKRNTCDCLKKKYKFVRSQAAMGCCFHCYKNVERKKLFVCSRCKITHYCSSDCQKANWPRHKAECKKN